MIIDMSSRWLIIFETGATHSVPGDMASTPEEAINVAYGGLESCTGLIREKMVKTVGVLDLSSMHALNYGLGLYNMRIINTPEGEEPIKRPDMQEILRKEKRKQWEAQQKENASEPKL